MPDRYDAGMAVRRRVLGDAHVDSAEAAKTALDAGDAEALVDALHAAIAGS